MKTIISLFEQSPHTWNLRGDPHLWREMREHFAETPFPETVDELTRLIETAFETLTEHSVTETEPFFIKRFSHGGISSGYVSPDFWRNKVIPLICEQFQRE